MKTTRYLAIILSFISSACFAQSNFKSGYVINLKGDTLHGFIDYREWDKNPNAISFRPDASNASSIFSANDIRGFAVNGESYECFAVKLSQDKTSLIYLSSGVDTTSTRAVVFLRVLAKGAKLSLYNYNDENKSRFYISTASNQQPEELVYHVYLRGPNAVDHDRRYRVQLLYLAKQLNADSPGAERKINGANYAENDLVKLTQIINAGNTVIYNQTSGVRFFIGTGINYNTLNFRELSSDASTLHIKNTPLPYISAGIDVLKNKSTQKVFLRVELFLEADHHDIQGVYPTINPLVTRNTSENYWQYSALLSPQIVWNIYNKESFKVFADLGFNVIYSGYNNYAYTETYGTAQSPSVKQKFPEYQTIGTTFLSPAIKAGVTINKKMDLFIGYQTYSNISSNSAFSAQTNGYMIGIHYLFN